MSAKECLTHPWLSESNSCNPVSGIELTLMPSPEKSTSAEPDVGSPNSNDDQFKSRISDHCNNCISPVQERKSSLSIGFCKSVSPKANGSTASDPKEAKTGAHRNSVDMMVAQFEGLTMSKRIVFSEEIIVDERVSMVY